MTEFDKLAALRQLAEELDVDRNTKEGTFLMALLDVMDSMTGDISDLEANLQGLSDSVNELHDEIAYLEDPESEEEEEAPSCSGNCASCAGCSDAGAEYEVTCPNCGRVIPLYEEDIEFGSVICPVCSEEFELESEDE